MEMLGDAQKPMLVLGGSRWTAGARDAVREFAESWQLPVACEFRRQMLFDPRHPNYAGDVGLGVNPALAQRIREADFLVLLGGRFPEIASGGYTLVDVPRPAQTLVHVHPGSSELGRVYAAGLQLQATPVRFLEAVNRHSPPEAISASTHLKQRVEQAHRDYLEWSAPKPLEAVVDPGAIVQWLRERLPDDAVICNGAGNHTQWLHRFYHYRGFGTQVAPTSGSMGYGLPAAVAAGLRFPDRTVLCVSGDGCFQMTAMELATAVQYQVPVVILVFDNAMHGTIRMHQERSYPGRPIATGLMNPDFCALARACGAHGELVSATGEFEAAFERAAGAGGPALIHIRTDPDIITPSASLSGIRQHALESQ